MCTYIDFHCVDFQHIHQLCKPYHYQNTENSCWLRKTLHGTSFSPPHEISTVSISKQIGLMELRCFIKMESYIVYSFISASSTPYNDYDIHSHCFHWSLLVFFFLYIPTWYYIARWCHNLFIHYSLVDVRIVPNY